MKCVSYTRTMPWKNHAGELTIADQNQRIAEYLSSIYRKSILTVRVQKTRVRHLTK